MKARVLPRYADVTPPDTAGKSVVVIDAFRTTTVMVTALDNGAASIYPAESADDARSFCRSLAPGSFLLAGERRAIRIEGFHLGNSPFSFSRETVAGKTIVMTTSNGTRTVRAAAECARLHIGSFSNVSAVTSALLAEDADVCIVCAGTLGGFSLEDGLCAGMMLARLEKETELELCDLGWVVKSASSGRPADMRNAVARGSLAYRIMEETGYSRDVDYCLRTDTSRTVPTLHGDGMIRSDATPHRSS